MLTVKRWELVLYDWYLVLYPAEAGSQMPGVLREYWNDIKYIDCSLVSILIFDQTSNTWYKGLEISLYLKIIHEGQHNIIIKSSAVHPE